jgi:hypothetical protein
MVYLTRNSAESERFRFLPLPLMSAASISGRFSSPAAHRLIEPPS